VTVHLSNEIGLNFETHCPAVLSSFLFTFTTKLLKCLLQIIIRDHSAVNGIRSTFTNSDIVSSKTITLTTVVFLWSATSTRGVQ